MDRTRPVFAWAMYDFANSAYVTTVATALLPAYFAAVVARGGLEVGHTVIPAVSLWGYALSLAALLVFVAAPVMGAIADKGGLRKRFLVLSCLAGSVSTGLVSLSGPGDIYWALGFFICAHVAFNAGNTFYDAFLPDIASPRERDRVSSLGYAYGYAGGGLQLALALGLVEGHQWLGIGQREAVQLGMALAGAWWLGFALITFNGLRELPGKDLVRPSWGALAAQGFKGAWEAARKVRQTPNTFRFLLAYILYNDGVQTVISMATIYGKEEIGLSEGVLVLTLLGIQAVALVGAMAFSWLAHRFGAKQALMLSLVGWTAIAVYGRTITTAGEYFGLGVAVGLVLGGSQALSRSVYSQLVPKDEPAVYFGFFSVLTKLSAVLGPLLFAVVRQTTGSARPAVLALVVFFVAGLALLSRVRVENNDA
jgi:UMF1 family MFS transporter